MTDERTEELFALAALGELTSAETEELERLVAGDAELRAELDATLAAAAEIQALPPVAPPDHLRSAVLGAIAETPQEPDTRQPTGEVAPNVVPLRRRRSAAWLVAAALLVVIGGAVVVNVVTDGRTDVVAEVLEADDARVRVLDGDLGTSAAVVFSASSDAVVVEAIGVAAIDESEIYVLWLIDDAGATAAGTFRPDDDGTVQTRLDGVDPTALTLGVTVEAEDDIAIPTPPVLATG